MGEVVSEDARPLLLFFYSSHSGPARRMDSLVAHLTHKERARLRVVRVDADERRELAERLAVGTVPTLVLVKDKRVVARLEGRSSAPRIDAMLQAHLEAARAAA